jgi:hypothetical protein
MDEATQSGAENQGNEASFDDELLGRLSEMVDGSDAGEEGGQEGGETEQSDAQPEQAQPETPAEEAFVIKVDGEDRTLTRAELIAEAQKAAAANKRFEEAAALRKQAEAERAPLQQERAQLKQVLDTFVPQMQALMQAEQPNWEELIATNPQEYLRQRHVFEARAAQLQQAQAAQAYLMQQQQAEAAQQTQARIDEEGRKLRDAIPEWKDPDKYAAGAKAIVEFLTSSGFDAQELNGINDHRLLLVADKARKYDELIKQQSQAAQKVNKLPPKVERPGTGMKPGDGRSEAMRRLSKTGSVEAGAAAILQFLD